MDYRCSMARTIPLVLDSKDAPQLQGASPAASDGPGADVTCWQQCPLINVSALVLKAVMRRTEVLSNTKSALLVPCVS